MANAPTRESTGGAVKIDSLLLPLLFAHATRRGVDARAVAAEHGVEYREDGPVSAPVDVVTAIADRCEALLGEPHIALAVAASAPKGVWGVGELAARYAPTVGVAMRRVARFSRLIPPYQVIEWMPVSGEIHCTYRMTNVKPPFAGRHANELAVARLFRFVSELPEVPLRPRAIWFAHPPIADTRPLLAHFDTDDVRFLADTNGFSLAADVEDLAVVTSDPATLRVLTEYAEALLPRAGPTDELLSRLSEIVAGLVPDGGPTLQDVARRSGIGARTLQRRLADHGLTFATLVDGVRSDLAQHMLRDRGLAVTEAAFLLGYADGRAFARAFRRWTGKTPDSWRREARGQPPAR